MTQRPRSSTANTSAWPALPLSEWQDTYSTLHMWTQVVGKVALALVPPVNHWWQTALRVNARGLTTLPLPHGERTVQLAFDFVDHQLKIRSDDGQRRVVALAPRPVAQFYAEVMAALDALDLGVKIWTTPVEVADPIPFERDYTHSAYDPEYAQRFWRILTQANRLFDQFRSRFVGKVSPSQFFWGSFDLAVTRFSGRRAPEYTGGAFNVARSVMEEAYSHEVHSVGFWPGGGAVDYPAFYAYAYPAPTGFDQAAVQPGGAFYNKDLGEFILPYDVVRQSDDPDAAVLAFAQSTYEAAADLARWDRAALERDYTARPG